MIYLGEKKVWTMYLGDKKLSKIYLGEKLVWEGYPEGHIIGKTEEANVYLEAYGFNDAKGNAQTLSCTSDANKKYDLDLTPFGGYGNGSHIFFCDPLYTTIDSFKVTMYVSDMSYEVCYCDSLTKINLNGIKFAPENTAENNINISVSVTDCSKLEYPKIRNYHPIHD